VISVKLICVPFKYDIPSQPYCYIYCIRYAIVEIENSLYLLQIDFLFVPIVSIAPWPLPDEEKQKQTEGSGPHASLPNLDIDTYEDEHAQKSASPDATCIVAESRNDIENCESSVPLKEAIVQGGGLAFDDIHAILKGEAEVIINDENSKNKLDSRLIPLEDVDSDRHDTSLLEIQSIHSNKLYGVEACKAESWEEFKIQVSHFTTIDLS
jgi:hypothetical protein